MSPSTEWSKLPSRVAGLVPLYNDAIESNQKLLGDCGSDGSVFQVDKWQASDWLEKGDERRMAKFTQYAIGATEMALRDAGIRVSEMRREELEMMGVCLGSGIGNFEEIYDTSLAYSNGVSICSILPTHCDESEADICIIYRVTRKFHLYLCRNFSST